MDCCITTFLERDIPEETPHNMLQQPHSLLVHELSNHITQNGPYRVKPFVCLANILQAHIIQQDLLHDEDRDCLAEFAAGLHDTEAEGDDFGGEEEVYHFGAVVFD